MSIDATTNASKAEARIIRDAEAYEPTPQEIRWAQIEHHATMALALIRKGGVIGMTGEARGELKSLARVLGVPADLEVAPPLVR
jgi:hypothetical protein